jgi:hypothetical protein
MPRQSIEQLQVNFVVPRGDAGFWAIIRELDAAGPWGWREVDKRSNVHERSVRDYIKRLELAGFVERVSQGTTGLGSKATQYRLIQSPIEAPRIDRKGKVYPESKQQRLWRSMRMAKTFSLPELRDLAAGDDMPMTLTLAQFFTKALVGVGVVQPIGSTASAERIYRLARDLGPIAPKISLARVVFDPNGKCVLGQPVLEDANGDR